MTSFADAVFYVAYRALLWPLLRATFALLSLFQPKIKTGLKMRARDETGRPPWLDWERERRPIWIHCASGEFEYAKPVITRLKAAMPEIPILVTYFSPSIAKGAKGFPGVDFACPSPWDRAGEIDRFIDWHQPRLLLVSRTDTWPEMLAGARRARVPSLLFSATLAAGSGRTKGIARWMSRAVFAHLDGIFCVSDEDMKAFASLGFGRRARVAGDTRYDQVMARLKNPKPIREELFDGVECDRVLVAGSTWDEDEQQLIDAAFRLRDRLRFVLVPHEPTPSHLADLEKKLAAVGLESVRYSTASEWPAESVLLVDQVGILAELYQRGSLAFVGGSFKKTVHSVMEPLAAGCVTFVGPLHLNNREALEFKRLPAHAKDLHVTCVQEILSGEDLERKWQIWQESHVGVADRIREEIARRSGKSDLVVEWCRERLK